jgi:hypothetical protein
VGGLIFSFNYLASASTLKGFLGVSCSLGTFIHPMHSSLPDDSGHIGFAPVPPLGRSVLGAPAIILGIASASASAWICSLGPIRLSSKNFCKEIHFPFHLSVTLLLCFTLSIFVDTFRSWLAFILVNSSSFCNFHLMSP